MSSPVTKSVPFLVAPSAPTPAGTIRLTDMDSALASLVMSAVLIFEHPIDQPAETIRRALSQALVRYYPFAGRLTVDEQGTMKIASTGEGVAFVAASASCTLLDAALTDRCPPVTVEDLTVGQQYYSADKERPPLMLVQVTEFTCGGFVFGMSADHVLTDGFGISQFLQAVGGFVRGQTSPAVDPIRVDVRLPELPPPIISMTKSLVASPHNDFPCSYIRIPTSFINKIKADFRHSFSGQHTACTTFDVFVATIWKCRARATTLGETDQEAPMALVFTANVREQAGARDGYYGNLFGFGIAMATCTEVANGDLLGLVRLVREAKELVTDTFTDGYKQLAEEMVPHLRGMLGYDTLFVTSWWKLGLDDVDFGGGGAALVMGNMETKIVPACILCGSKDKADEGVGAMALCVKEEHQEAFHAELERLVG